MDLDRRIQAILIGIGWIIAYMLVSLPFEYELFEQVVYAFVSGAAIGSIFLHIQRWRNA